MTRVVGDSLSLLYVVFHHQIPIILAREAQHDSMVACKDRGTDISMVDPSALLDRFARRNPINHSDELLGAPVEAFDSEDPLGIKGNVVFTPCSLLPRRRGEGCVRDMMESLDSFLDLQRDG